MAEPPAATGWRARLRSIPLLAALRSRLVVAAGVAGVLIPISAIVGYSRMPIDNGQPGDYMIFGPAGAAVLRGRWDLVFSHADNAGGPFEFFPYGGAYVLHISGDIGWTTFYTVLLTVIIFLLALVLMAPLGLTSGRRSFYITLGIGALGLLAGYLGTTVLSGHTADFLIPLLWLAGAVLARDRNFVACGITVGLSVGFESWGVLGFAVVFVVLKPRLIPAAIAGFATIAVIWGPFIATGVFRVVDFHWPVFPVSIYGILFPHLHRFTWSLRALQAVVSIAAGVGVALLTRRTRYAPWLVPLAIVAARLAADPLLHEYYWVAPAALALSGLGAAVYLRAWIPTAVSAGLVVWFWLPRPAPFLTAAGLLVAVLICAVVVRAASQHTRGTPRRVVADIPTQPML